MSRGFRVNLDCSGWVAVLEKIFPIKHIKMVSPIVAPPIPGGQLDSAVYKRKLQCKFELFWCSGY
jgi:hypothetical protein